MKTKKFIQLQLSKTIVNKTIASKLIGGNLPSGNPSNSGDIVDPDEEEEATVNRKKSKS